jgi:light-regulated signal transduction histidine kinase (bacteriophytochrome)
MINGYELSEVNPALLHKNFYRITCSDNGIGFDNQFITKIFKIFQRLHNEESEYSGKGIGLAICQRIMANHEGYMIAHGQPNMGAKFKLFFPVEV